MSLLFVSSFLVLVASVWGSIAIGSGGSSFTRTAETAVDLGLTPASFDAGKKPDGWKLKIGKGSLSGRVSAVWSRDEGTVGVRLQSDNSLTFLKRAVRIDITEHPIISWRWRVDAVLEGINEYTEEGDDHPIRIFLVFEPDTSRQSFGFRLKRFFYLDRIHGHAIGGRFMEYLWSSHLDPGDIIPDPAKPVQKLIVVEGGDEKLGMWIGYRRNVYQDFRMLYGEEPRTLIFIGIINDTDDTGQSATSWISDLTISK